MRKKVSLTAVAAALLLTACGPGVPDLSKGNNDTAAQYVADALLRNDKHYDEGIDYDHSLLVPTPTPEPTPAAVKPDGKEDGKNGGSSSSGTSGNGASAENVSRKSVSVSDIYGVKGVTVTPVSYQLKSSYGSSVYQIMPTGKGNRLAVVYFNIANKTKKSKRVNLAKKEVSAELIVNGKSVGSPMLSLTDNDLQNMNVMLDAGKKKQGVFLFEVSKKTKVSSVEIHFTTDTKEATSSVK
ncbi:MAG: DUF5067 domain-containing protein [Lachnospiraceae bacterium]|nr:DUF5067 domain-containing protein [Lachnospiraceae bacterium]